MKEKLIYKFFNVAIICLLVVLSIENVKAFSDLPTLTINEIKGNSTNITIYYTATDPQGNELTTTNWEFKTERHGPWKAISETTIDGNFPKLSGKNIISWKAGISTGEVNDPTVPIWFRMQVRDAKGEVTSQTVYRGTTKRSSGLCTAQLDGRIYLMGGHSIERSLATVDIYDTVTATWTVAAAMSVARNYAAATVVDGKIYIFGGMGINGYLSSVEVYNPLSDTWEMRSPMPTPRHSHSAQVIDGKVYLVGGHNNRSLATVEIYDATSDTWETATDMPTPRHGLAVATLDRKLYAIGGRSRASRPTAAVEVYDTENNRWHEADPLPIERYGAAAMSYADDGKLYVIGGLNANGAMTSIEVYDPKIGSWQTFDKLTGEMKFVKAELSAKQKTAYAVSTLQSGIAQLTEVRLPRYSSIADSRKFVVVKNLTAQIQTPLLSSYHNGVLTIKGTIESDELRSWTLDFATGMDPLSGYTPIALSAQEPINDQLAIWNSAEHADGIYTFRLRATNSAAETATSSVVFTIDNTPPSSPFLKIFTTDGKEGFIRSNAPIVLRGNSEAHAKIIDAHLIDDSGEEIEEVSNFITISENGKIDGEIPGLSNVKTISVSLIITLADRAGNQSEWFANTLVIDDESPSIEVLSPAMGSNFSSGKIHILGRAKDRISGLAKIEVNGGFGWQEVTTVSNNWTYDLTVPTHDVQLAIVAKATDKAGNVEFTRSTVVSYMTSLPTIDLLQPIEGEQLTKDVLVRGVVDNPYMTWQLEYAPTDRAEATSFQEIVSGTGESIDDGQLTLWDVSTLLEGRYDLRLTSEDTPIPISVVRRNLTRPADEVILPIQTLRITVEDSGRFIRSDRPIVISGTANPLAEVSSAELIGGDEIANVTDLLELTEDGHIYGEIPGINVGKVETLSLMLTLEYPKGKFSQMRSNELLIDDEAPEVALTAPAMGANFRGGEVEVTGKVIDGRSGLSKVELNDGTSWSAIDAIDRDGNWSYKFTPSTKNSQIVFQVRAIDGAGNVRLSNSVAISYIANLPTANITTPIDNSELSDEVLISGSIDGAVRWRLEFAEGEDAEEGFQLIATGTARPIFGEIATWDISNLSEGSYTLRLTVENALLSVFVKRRNLSIGE